MKHPPGRTRQQSALRKFGTLVGALAISAPLLAACSGGSDGITINVYGGTSDVGFDKIVSGCNDAAKGKYTIVGNLLPSDADGQREQFVRRLAAKDTGLDVLGMDVTWTAEFAEAGWIRELTGTQKKQASDGVLAPPLLTATWKDKLYGIPRTTNVQLMWYRKSLVPNPPKTWDEMLSQAKALKAAGKPYQIGFTGKQYEGYVVGFNTILNSYGGTLVNETGTKVTVDDKTVKALALLKKFATAGLTSVSLSNDAEPEVFNLLQSGQAAFILNWPYVLSALQTDGKTNPQSKKIVADLGYAPYPAVVPGETPKVTLGGMNYAISKYSEHPAEAYEAAMCLRNPANQLDGALVAGNVPVLQSVFDEPKFQKAYPMYEDILAELKVAVPRPRTVFYQNISTIVSSTLSPPSSINPKADAEELKTKIEETLNGQGILP